MHRIEFDVDLYPLSFFANTPFNISQHNIIYPSIQTVFQRRPKELGTKYNLFDTEKKENQTNRGINIYNSIYK